MPVPSLTPKKLTPILHVTPSNDMFEHVMDAEGACWCCPERDDSDPEEIMFVHFAYDRREEYEHGLRKPH